MPNGFLTKKEWQELRRLIRQIVPPNNNIMPQINPNPIREAINNPEINRAFRELFEPPPAPAPVPQNNPIIQEIRPRRNRNNGPQIRASRLPPIGMDELAQIQPMVIDPPDLINDIIYDDANNKYVTATDGYFNKSTKYDEDEVSYLKWFRNNFHDEKTIINMNESYRSKGKIVPKNYDDNLWAFKKRDKTKDKDDVPF